MSYTCKRSSGPRREGRGLDEFFVVFRADGADRAGDGGTDAGGDFMEQQGSGLRGHRVLQWNEICLEKPL